MGNDVKMKLLFYVNHPGEIGAGIYGFTDMIKIEIESGDPGGEEGEFAEFMREYLSEWFDGAKVVNVIDNEYFMGD